MGFSSENISLTLPKVVLIGNDFGGELSLPAVSLEARDMDGFATISVPLIEFDANSYNGAIGSIEIVVPLVTISTTSFSGILWNLDQNLPSVTLSASLIKDGSAQISLPAVSLSAFGGLLGVWDFNGSVPAIELSASFLDSAIEFDDYETWVINAESGHHSTYTNWPVTSHGIFNGNEIVATSDGLYLVGGTQDGTTDISSSIKWPASELNSHFLKRIDSVYVTMRHGGDFKLVLYCDETETREYRVDMQNFPEGSRPKRVYVGRGLQGRIWSFAVENVESSTFTIERAEVHPVILKRKLR